MIKQQQHPQLIRFDWAMKTILRDKANFDVLEGFLAALLQDNSIEILHILESEGNQADEDDKFNRVDLLAVDAQKRKFIIEIQNSREADYLERILYGTSKVIVENQDLGVDFKSIDKVISISILYFNLGSGDDYLYYGTTELRGMHTGNRLIVKKKVEVLENLQPKIRFVEKNVFPEYYLIKVEKFEDIIKQPIDEWIFMIKNNRVEDNFTSKNIDKARKKLEYLNMSEQKRNIYERYLINLARERNIVATAHDDGEKIGLEKGEKVGLEKGEKIGLEKGEKIGEDKKEVAMVIKMFKKGMKAEEISDWTDVSLLRVKSIIKNNTE